MSEAYKLEELARAASTSPRTVRYYVQRGLLPAPAFRGKDTVYGREHLIRLRAIRKLQQAFFPLDAIAVELTRLSLDEIEKIAERTAESPDSEPPLSTSAHSARQTPAVAPSMADRAGRMFRRIEIAPGVELNVAEDAPVASLEMVERILNRLED